MKRGLYIDYSLSGRVVQIAGPFDEADADRVREIESDLWQADTRGGSYGVFPVNLRDDVLFEPGVDNARHGLPAVPVVAPVRLGGAR